VYRKILAAVELFDHPARLVLSRAGELARGRAELWAVHVVEPQYVQYSFDPTFTGSLTRSLEQNACDAAAARLAELCAPFGVPRERQLVVIGRTADRIHALCGEHGFDLVVLGSHGREGLRTFLGSTANAVLHHSSVDVATVRIPRAEP
jgi:universal stress protein A